MEAAAQEPATCTINFPLTGVYLARLATLREAWRMAVNAYATMGDGAETSKLVEAADWLVEVTGDPEARLKAAAAYAALAPFPLPRIDNEQLEDGMWDTFFRLVLAIQNGSALGPDFYSMLLAEFVSHDHDAQWWKDRARAYARLGLTFATRV